MLNVAVMSTNNPALILGAFALNGLYRVLSLLAALIAWLVPAVLGFVASHWRVVGRFVGLVAAVVLVAVFWQVVLVGVGVFGGMYAGLLVVVRS